MTKNTTFLKLIQTILTDEDINEQGQFPGCDRVHDHGCCSWMDRLS
ncbi:hypothetical protein [Domibacillus antri]|nr:hypothetical protein [Domibacillus antri]